MSAHSGDYIHMVYSMVRLIFTSALLAILPCVVHADEPLSADDFAAEIAFDNTCINFGELTHESGEQKFEFKFINSGNAPLVLTYVHPSCSCVKMEYPRIPIAPGDSASIKGYLNPALIHEKDFKRNIHVRSNTVSGPNSVFLVGKLTK